jgi:hypothetical protein
MTEREMPREEHLTDGEIVARLDEPVTGVPSGFSRHLEACSTCRERLAEMERVLAALRAEPPMMPSEASFAAQRERVMAAVAARPRKGATVHSIRRWWWAPLAAAAVVFGLLVLSPDEPPPLPSGAVDRAPGSTRSLGSPLPVVAEADQAAEEAFRAVARSETIGPDVDTAVLIEADEIEASLAALDMAETSVLTTPEGGSAIEEEFASLPAEDQAAILAELSTMTFDL